MPRYGKKPANSPESIWEVNAIGAPPNPKGIQQYTTVQDIRPRGWGFNTPSLDLANAYEPDDKRKAATIMSTGVKPYGMVK